MLDAESLNLEPIAGIAAGATVQIRTWEDMEAEYGLDDDDDIDCPGRSAFTPGMRSFCGARAVVLAAGPAADPGFRQGLTAEQLETMGGGQPIALLFEDPALQRAYRLQDVGFTAWMVELVEQAK